MNSIQMNQSLVNVSEIDQFTGLMYYQYYHRDIEP